MKGFTLIELLIVMAVIAALLGAVTPVGINAIRHARATTVALDLSEIAKAAMSNFYIDHNSTITINSIKNYFPSTLYKELEKFKIKISDNSSTVNLYVWYTGNDVNASDVQKVLSSVNATNNNKPMLSLKLGKYW